MSNTEKTHYRKAFNSPYLSSADITGPTVLTITHCTQSGDQTKKTKDIFNTAHFGDNQTLNGEKIKPMILNAGNCKLMRGFADSHYVEDWNNIKITIYVDSNVRFGRDTVEGLRISPQQPPTEKPWLTPDNTDRWEAAVNSCKALGNLDGVLAHMQVSEENQQLIKEKSIEE